MSKFKLQEVIEKAEISFEDALEKLKEINIDVLSPDDMVDEKAASHLGVDPKILSVDKRQELLKKALERHKRHARPKEIVIKKTDDVSKRISKEELLRKKRELEKSLKKMDEEREKFIKVKQEELNKEKKVEEVKNDQEKTQPVEDVKTASGFDQLVAEFVTPAKPEEKKEVQKSSQSKQSEEKAKPVHSDRKDQRIFNRRPREHSDFRRVEKTSETKQFKDRKSEQKLRREDDSRVKAVFKRQDDIDKPSETFEKLKKVDIDKKKETPKEDLETKKVKTKKGIKKEKNLVKDILEGFDELELEEAIVKGEIEDGVFIDEDVVTEKDEEIVQSSKGKRQQKPKKKDRSKESKKQEPVKITKVEIGESITVNELAGLFGIKAVDLVKKLFSMGVMTSVNQAIDAETAQLLGAEYDIEVVVKTITEDDLLPKYDDNPDKMKPRPPIVTVMGHVDHGKTSLLDAIRKTRVAEGEAGGITQHIGAYEVDLNGRSITFLDTPGHEAFTTLRARGANVTDIVILVVAADDGVMPQTKEAIDHAKAAGVRLVVAVNKIDKPNANPEKVKTQLAEYGIIPEEWGGDTQFQEISAKNRIGIEDLLERVLLEADILELKADYDRLAEGVIIESRLDKQRGPVGTVLVRKGTLKSGDFFVVGSTFGKVRAMFNSVGRSVKSAGPSVPVEVMGFSSIPESGQTFTVVPNEKIARQVAEIRMAKQKEADLREKSKISLNDLFDRIKEGEIQEINIVIKADVQGSLEALKTSLVKLSNQEVKVNIIHDGVGGINESDVLLASASNAFIIGFNVRPDNNARAVAERENVEINLYSVIYEAIENVKSAIEGMLSPEINENVIGRVEVRQVISVPKVGKVAGAYVLEGKIVRNAKVRVIRDNIVVYDGAIGSLKRFQDDVKEVAAGYECGVGIDRFNDIKEGDIIEVYQMVERKREPKELS